MTNPYKIASSKLQSSINAGIGYSMILGKEPPVIYIDKIGDGILKYESSDLSIATVSSEGKITAYKEGTVTITVSMAETEKYYASSKTYTLTIVSGNPIK